MNVNLSELAKQNYDTILFLPGEKDNEIRVEGSVYKDPGQKLDGSESGDCYHIILFKLEEEGNPIHLDKFEAILLAPLEYIARLIPDEWYGVVSKKTTTSQSFIESTFDKLKEMC